MQQLQRIKQMRNKLATSASNFLRIATTMAFVTVIFVSFTVYFFAAADGGGDYKTNNTKSYSLMNPVKYVFG